LGRRNQSGDDVTNCWDCGNEIREGAKFCDACGARIEPEATAAQAPVAPTVEDQDLAVSLYEDDGTLNASSPSEDVGEADSTDVLDSTGEPDSTDVLDSTGEPDSTGGPESGIDVAETEGEGPPDSAEPEAELPAEEPPKAGYLVFPDSTEQAIPPSQWLIGRADLAKFLPDPKKTSEISRGHLTVFQEGERFFIEDGTTMVQRKPSTNKTWLVRGSSRILVTGTGRNELQDDDEIDVAELVKLQFVMK
jgi:hypothetical protein